MATFHDLPNELVIEIIKDLVPHNEHESTIGRNAAWHPIETYHSSLNIRQATIDENDENENSLSSSPVFVSIYADLLSLRLVSSALNQLCLPFVFENLNILKTIGMPFEEFFALIVKPYAQYVKVVRIYFSDDITTDQHAAEVLNATINCSNVLLYHINFLSPDILFSPQTKPETEQQDLSQELELDWMHHTNEAVIRLLHDHSLHSLGLYATNIIDNYWWDNSIPDETGPLRLLSQIMENPTACKALKKLDIAINNIPQEIYYLIRRNLQSLTSLTVHHAFRQYLPRFWHGDDQREWNLSHRLTHLFFKKCANAYAPHIPHLVRHVPSLRHLMVSMCGYFDDTPVHGKVNRDWRSSPNALWKVRQPLDTLQIEHMDDWEIGSMGEIPVKNLILANTNGGHFMAIFAEHSDYFPKLEAISIEPLGLRDDVSSQFTDQELELLTEICQKRSLSIARNAQPTAIWPSHYI